MKNRECIDMLKFDDILTDISQEYTIMDLVALVTSHYSPTESIKLLATINSKSQEFLSDYIAEGIIEYNICPYCGQISELVSDEDKEDSYMKCDFCDSEYYIED